jgi:hypothetical protein
MAYPSPAPSWVSERRYRALVGVGTKQTKPAHALLRLFLGAKADVDGIGCRNASSRPQKDAGGKEVNKSALHLFAVCAPGFRNGEKCLAMYCSRQITVRLFLHSQRASSREMQRFIWRGLLLGPCPEHWRDHYAG